MSFYSDKAGENFRNGCNCAQAVLCAFSEYTGLSIEESMKLASSFGGGMGRLREVCGAVSAMFMIAGILKGYSVAGDELGKTRHYQLIQHLASKFKDKHETIICRELLSLQSVEDSPIPSARTEQYYKERPCENFICTAAEIIESELLN
ncbi:C_GCAxxG_C_C family protein [bacterium]|nr:C_GCAxxG_C_C family protein [bacterium]